ncbi:MAG TPA: hypothetical protein VLA66_04425, partial [Thermoanaerobaculia bacterium]|nr:hypothetical protein [Thermoanaerobaculia bacterium]
MAERIDPRLREAFEEVDSYLADLLAPLLVADSVEVLLDYPVELSAELLRSWALSQYEARGGRSAMADLLYHAIKKIQLLEEHKLLPEDRFAAFLASLAGKISEGLAAADRERL